MPAPEVTRAERKNMMFALEYKELYIVQEAMTKNRTCQSYRWKQYAISEDKDALEAIRATQKRPDDWRIIKMAFSHI